MAKEIRHINDTASDLPEGFKMTKLGLLPEEWEVVKLGGVATLTMGQSPPSSTYNTKGQGTPFLQGKAEFGEVYPRPIKWCSRPQRIAKRGSVLISVRAPVGDVNIAFDDYCIGRGLAAIMGKDSLDNSFLFNYLRFAKGRLEEQGTGSTFKSINKRVLQNFLIPLPPLSEQKAIAYVLQTVQRAKEATEKVIQETQELKKSLMRHLFTYGPVPVNEVDKVPLKETEIGLVPEHWEVVRLGEVAETTSGGTPSRKHPEYFGGKIPWVKSGELNDNLISYTEETLTDAGLWNSNAKVFPKGTLLVAMYGATAGKVGILECDAATNQAVCAIFPHKGLISRYLFYVFIHRRTKLLSERYGGAQPNISQTVIKGFNIPLPPLAEQHQIARILGAVDKKLQAEEARKQALEALFKTLLHNLMTGKIRVKNLVLPKVREREGGGFYALMSEILVRELTGEVYYLKCML